jgi:3-deoxy-D-manno-octulosonate 8-phosphate phosphatase KdsC-like HAD superfamily phosphatase
VPLHVSDDILIVVMNRDSTCPQDASPEIKGICSHISHVGGKGAARDVIEQVMKTQGNGWLILMENMIDNQYLVY